MPKKAKATTRKPKAKKTIMKTKIPRRIPQAPPSTTFVKLKYTDIRSISSTGGTVGQYVFRVNDLFDVDYTGVGHQSLFRDQYYNMYAWGRCVAQSIKVDFMPNTYDPHHVGISMIPTIINDGDVELCSERKGVTQMLSLNQQPRTMKLYNNTNRYFGSIKSACYSDDRFRQDASTALNADVSCWMQVLARNIAGNSSTIYFRITIYQYVKFEKLVQVGKS